jgi:hypothetical protein
LILSDTDLGSITARPENYRTASGITAPSRDCRTALLYSPCLLPLSFGIRSVKSSALDSGEFFRDNFKLVVPELGQQAS